MCSEEPGAERRRARGFQKEDQKDVQCARNRANEILELECGLAPLLAGVILFRQLMEVGRGGGQGWET